MNYSELTNTIEETTENTFEASQLATFVKQAEQFIYNAVQPPALRKNQTGNVTAASPYLALPTDYLYTNSVAIIDEDSNYHYLLHKEVNFIREAYPNSNSQGLPKHYSNFNKSYLLIGPTPNQNYGVEIHYGYYPESIVTAGTTWLGDNFDIALLNASLVEASKFMKSDPDIADFYRKSRDESMLLFDSLADGKLRQDTYRNDSPRSQIM